jgi:hypothetical protein
MALIQTLKRYPLLTYFVLVYVLSWACWIPLAIAKTSASFPFIVIATLWNIMPSLVGILLTALFSGKSGLGALFRRLGQVRVPLIWYAFVLLYPPVLWLVALGVPTLLGLTTIAFAFPVVGVFGSFVSGLVKSSAGGDSPCHECKLASRHWLPACCSASSGGCGISRC